MSSVSLTTTTWPPARPAPAPAVLPADQAAPRAPRPAALRRLVGLPRVLERLNTPAGPQQLCDVVADALFRELSFDDAVVLAITGPTVRCMSYAGKRSAPPVGGEPVALIDLDAELAVVRRRRPALLPAGHGLTLAALPADSILAPVCHQGQVIGLLQASSSSPGQLGPADVDIVAALAVAASGALERASTERRAHRQSLAVREAAAALEAIADGARRPTGGLLGSFTTGPRGRVDESLPLTAQRLQQLLSQRELEVIDLLAAGASNAEVAAQLVITTGTVKTHVKSLLRKLHAANRAQAVAIYLRLTHQATADHGA